MPVLQPDQIDVRSLVSLRDRGESVARDLVVNEHLANYVLPLLISRVRMQRDCEEGYFNDEKTGLFIFQRDPRDTRILPSVCVMLMAIVAKDPNWCLDTSDISYTSPSGNFIYHGHDSSHINNGAGHIRIAPGVLADRIEQHINFLLDRQAPATGSISLPSCTDRST